MKRSYKKGFTLIELLVVISIIGVLSSVVLSSLSTARAKARDANRTASIKELQTALELYYNKNGYYPSSPDVGFPSQTTPGVLETALIPDYISQIPKDPQNVSPYIYHYYNGNTPSSPWYAIWINYENTTINIPTPLGGVVTVNNCFVCMGPEANCPTTTNLYWATYMCR